MFKNLLLGSIRAYQYFISPFVGPACRFHPSCSAYASEVIRLYGAAKGTRMGLVRLLKCHPFNPGGYDPVVKPGQESS